MKWSLRTFLIAIPMMALIFAWLVQSMLEPKSEGTISCMGPNSSGPEVLLPRLADAEVARAIEQIAKRSVWGNTQKVVLKLPLEIEEVEAWIDPKRTYPLIGPAELHHRIWRCEFETVAKNGTTSKRAIHVDQNHFHFR